ncbi:MAG: hypothetical protein SOY65_03080 [Marinifilaceae bacterium]|nr:hypothetical protein [Marinifilaceae bacterium]
MRGVLKFSTVIATARVAIAATLIYTAVRSTDRKSENALDIMIKKAANINKYLTIFIQRVYGYKLFFTGFA